MIAVIGSHAFNKQYLKRTGESFRNPKDIDLVGEINEIEQWVADNLINVTESYASKRNDKMIYKAEGAVSPYNAIVEAEIVGRSETAAALHKLILDDPKSIFEGDMVYASLDICYLLKMSHRYLKNSSHFLKTMRDIHILRKLGATIREEHESFYKVREKATYWYKHPKLNVNKDAFFDREKTGVIQTFDHDSIHVSIARGEKPAYEYFKGDTEEVFCDMDKFFTLPTEIQLNAVYEESCVLALERSIVPFGTDYEKAFVMALEKVCTSITSGRFRSFAWENYAKVRRMFSEQTFDKFFDDVAQGLIPPPSSNTMMTY